MKTALGICVAAVGLMVVAGCAREDRWTLDGTKPGRLDDGKDVRRQVYMYRTPDQIEADEAIASRKVEVVTENGYAAVRNKRDTATLAVVEVTPGKDNVVKEEVHEMAVLVPAGSDMRVGRVSGQGTADTWSYKLLSIRKP